MGKGAFRPMARACLTKLMRSVLKTRSDNCVCLGGDDLCNVRTEVFRHQGRKVRSYDLRIRDTNLYLFLEVLANAWPASIVGVYAIEFPIGLVGH